MKTTSDNESDTVHRRGLSPSLIARAARCLHAWELECHGDPADKAQPSVGTQMLWRWGVDHEVQTVANISYVEPRWNGEDRVAGAAATRELMTAGVEWIYQGVLVGDDIRGLPDLLQRIDAPSALGQYSYRPVEIKGHREVTRKDRFQVASYAAMLEPILGTRPPTAGVWLNTGEVGEVDLLALQPEYDDLVRQMLEVRDGTSKTQGFRCSECGLCPWVDHCYEQWLERSCVCLVRYTTGDTARRLFDAGHRSYIDLAAVSEERIAAVTGVDEQTAAIIRVHAQARVDGRQISRTASPLAIPPLTLHYDIETFGDVVYLHGLVIRHGDGRDERSFLARRPEDEGAAWHALLDHLAQHEGAVIYTWTDYERGFVDELWRKYGGNEVGWRVLDQGMVDLCKVVQDHYALPVATYSLKEVAPVFGFAWQAEDAGGLNSEAWYGEWLANGDETMIDKLVEYNLDDVRAMEVVLDHLAAAQGD